MKRLTESKKKKKRKESEQKKRRDIREEKCIKRKIIKEKTRRAIVCQFSASILIKDVNDSI